jgi:hypothetical protein
VRDPRCTRFSIPEDLEEAFQRSAITHVLHLLICLNRVNAVAAYRGYRDNPQIGTNLTTTLCGLSLAVPEDRCCGLGYEGALAPSRSIHF